MPEKEGNPPTFKVVSFLTEIAETLDGECSYDEQKANAKLMSASVDMKDWITAVAQKIDSNGLFTLTPYMPEYKQLQSILNKALNIKE